MVTPAIDKFVSNILKNHERAKIIAKISAHTPLKVISGFP